MGSVFLVAFFVFLFIVLVSHLTVSKDIPDEIKIGAWVIFGLISVSYVVFGLIL